MLAFETLKVAGNGAPTSDRIPVKVKKFPSSGPPTLGGTMKSVRMSGSPAMDTVRMAHTIASDVKILRFDAIFVVRND